MTTIDPVQLHELQGASELRAATDREQDPAKRNALLHEQWKNHLESDIIAELQGKDPVSNLTPAARVTSPEVHEKFVVPRLGQRFGELKKLKDRPEIRGAIDLYSEHIEQFKKLNAVPLAKLGPYATPDDIALAQLQMKKLEIPEESRQSILFGLGEMNRLGREIEPTYDIRNDPDFKHIIDGIGVDAGPGYFTEGTVEEDFGTPLGRIGYEGARAFDEGLANAGNALMDVGLSVMAAINPSRDNQELLNQFRAEAYGEAFVDRQGNFVSRAPRAQSATGLAYLATRMGTMKTVDDIRQRMERVAEAETIMRAHERGWLEEAATATTIGLGSLASFVATGGGRLMGGGVQLVERGKLGAALLLGAKDGTRLHKAAKLLRTGLGMGIGNGVYHATLYGRPEGYAKAFIHSLPMGLVFAAAGAAGKATEKLLAQRTSMPKFVRRGIAGAVEGLALTPGSALEMQSALWEFMRDANPETSNRLMKEVLANTLSFGLWKAATGSTPAESRSFFQGVPQPVRRAPGRGVDWIKQKAQQFQTRQQERRAARAQERAAEEKAREPYRFERPTKEDFAKGVRAPTKVPDRPPTELPERAPTELPERAPTRLPEREPTRVEPREPTQVPFRPATQPTEGMGESRKGLISTERTRWRTQVPEREPTRVPKRGRTAPAERAPSVERTEQAPIEVKPSERAALGDVLDPVTQGVHTVADRQAVAERLVERLEEARAAELDAKVRKDQRQLAAARREVRTIMPVLRRLKVQRMPTEAPEREPTEVDLRASTRVPPRPATGIERQPGEHPFVQETRLRRPETTVPDRPPTELRPRAPTVVPPRRLSEVEPARESAARATQAGEEVVPRESRMSAEEQAAADARDFQAEAQWRVVDFDKLTEAEQRKVDAERRRGKPKSFNQRMKALSELQDPMERTDFLELPEGVRARILAAPHELARKAIWFEHISTSVKRGGGDRRQGERRQGGKEIRPSVYPRPHVAAELRRTAKMDRSTARLAELIPDEPRLLQPGEIRALQDLIQEHVARLQGIEIGRGTVPYGKTKAEAIRENARRLRLLNEAFRVLRDMRPQEIERVAHEEPIRFDAATGKLLNEVVGAGTTRTLAGPHIASEREAVLKRIREKIEDFAAKARATELNEGRGSYRLSRIKAKLKRLRGVERRLDELGQQAVIAEAQLEGEPGLEGVPRIGGRLRVEELIEQVQEAGEMRRMLEAAGAAAEAGAAPRETTAEHHPNGNPYPNQTTRYHEARHRISQGNGTEHDIEFVRLADKATAQMRADDEAPTANANRLSLMQAKLAEQIEAKGKTEPRAEAETEPQREAETEAEMLVRVARETEIPQGSAAELDVMAAEAELALNAVQALGFSVGEVPGPRAGQPASLRLLPQLRPVPPEGEEPTPTRARDVVAALEGRTQDPVQIRIRGDVRIEGEKIPGGVLGWFSRRDNQIRLRTPRALLAATHESAHAMDNRLQARGAWRDGGTTDIPDVLYEQLAQAAWTYPGIPQAFATSKLIETALRSGVHPKHGTPLQPSEKHSLGIQLRKIKDFVQAEGFAEFWARWRLEDPALKQETPILWDFMLNELMERPELAEFKAMNNYQRQVLAAYRDQGAEMRVQMARVMETDEPTEVEQQFRPSGLGEATQSFKKSMLDDLADAKVAWEKWRKASEMGVENPLRIPISMDPIRLTEALRMTAYSQADRAVNTGTFDIFGNRTGEPLEQVFRDLIEGAPKELRGEIVRLFLNYATAKRSVALEEFPRRKAREKAIREALLDGASKEEAEAAGEQAALRAKVPDTGIHRADADFVIGKYERSPLREPFDEALKRIREWSLNILDYGVESGYLRPSDVEAMALAYDVYLPFHRAIESSEGAVVERLLGRGVSEHPAGLKSFEGTDIEIRDPLVGLRAMAYDIIQRSQRYMVMQSLYLQSRVLNPRLVANRQAALGSFVTQVARDAEPRRVLIDQIAKQLRKAGEALAEVEKDPTIIDRAEQIADDLIALFGDAGGALTFFFPMERPTGSRPRIAFRPNVHHRFLEEMDLTPAERVSIERERGRTLWFELDETLFNALMTIDAPRPLIDNMPRLVEAILIGPARLVAGGATVYNPYFVARNIARDTMSATVYKRGKEGYTLMGAIADAYRAAKAQRAAGKGTENFYSRYANLGLEGASIYGAHFARQARGSGASLTAEFHRGATQFLRFFQRGLNKWGRKLAKPESWHRSIEFRDVEDKELREGAPRMDAQLEAMLAAKEVSGNFTRAGNIARAVNQLVPYYAPNLAGKRKMLRVMSGREGKDAQRAFWARAAVNVTAMTLAVAAWNLMWEDDAEWREDLPEWKRLNYWNIRMPGGNSIPLAKPFELGQVFATLPEAILDAARLAHGDEFFGTAVKNLTEEFSASVTNAWKVAAVVPFIETIANHSFFKERSLVPAWMQKSRLPEDQFTRYSTGLAKTLGKVFGMSPILIDNLLAGYTGGLGLSLARGADQLVDGIRRGDFGAILGAPFSGLHPSHPHELGAYADAIYDWSEWMTQAAGSDSLDPRLERLRPKVERVKAQIAEIRRSGLSQADADQRVFEIAKPVVDQLGSMHP